MTEKSPNSPNNSSTYNLLVNVLGKRWTIKDLVGARAIRLGLCDKHSEYY